jgi:hypothetical protein
MAEHEELVARGRRHEPTADESAPRPDRADRPGDPDRTRELRARPGWAWLRVFRRYDEYQLALDSLEQMRERDREPEHV